MHRARLFALGVLSAILSVTATADDRADLSLAIAWHDGSAPSGGQFPEALYDDDTTTLGLVNRADESVAITFFFAGPITVSGVRTFWSHASGDPAYEWDFACADSVADMSGHVGSYRLLAEDIPTVSDLWSVASFGAATCRVFQITGYRLTSDHYLHVNEIEIVLDDPASPAAGKLLAPAGIVVDASDNVVVADAERDALVVIDQAGAVVDTLGVGILAAPEDVAIDTQGRLVVADTGNDRVVRLTSGGLLDVVFADVGDGAGEVRQPSGVDLDDAGRVLVADRGHHRVLRLSGPGVADLTFGTGGAVGGPGPASDDTGFDSPQGVCWDGAGQQILVADTGNNRIQRLDVSGAYQGTVDAVYRPYGVVVAPDGTSYAVGDGTSFPEHNGSLRIIQPGAEFVSGQYLGGDAGVGRLTGGVALSNTGEIVASERSAGRIIRIPTSLTPEVEGVSFDVGADSATVRYRTRDGAATRVYFGEASLDRQAEDLVPVTDHEITINGLTAGTSHMLSVAYRRSQDGQFVFAPLQRFRTEPSNVSLMNVMRLRAVGMIYTSGYSAEEIERARERMQIVEEFYFRHSRGRLHLDIEIVEVSRAYTTDDVVSSSNAFKSSSAEADLAAAGYGPEDQVDEIIVFFGGVAGITASNRGGSAVVFDRQVGYCMYTTQNPWTPIHEVNHTIDSVYAYAGYDDYEYNHGLWALYSDLGSDLIVNAAILHNVPSATYSALTPPFERIIEVADDDGDGLTNQPEFPLTESSSGADSQLADTDFDGVTDRDELLAGTAVGSDPTLVDTDGDGVTQGADGIDRNPLIALEGYIPLGTPVIDGVHSAGEEWTLVSDRVDFSNPFLNTQGTDPDDRLETSVWVAWDETAVYLAFEYPASNVRVKLDANGDGWFAGYDNHFLDFNTTTMNRLAVAAAEKDLMMSIDDTGEWSEIYDDRFPDEVSVSRWLDPPPDGLGLERLIDPAMVSFATGSAPEGRTLAEIRIPAGARRSLDPHAGQEMRLWLKLDGDVIWDDDRFVRLLLVDPDDTDGDGLWDLQETDLGSSPASSDGDGDGLVDGDELAAGLDPMSADTDGDGVDDPVDCHPLDAGSIAVPAETAGIMVAGDDTLSWDASAAGDATRYDLVREEVLGPVVGVSCLSGGGLSEPEYRDEETPPPGEGWRYLVRARNRCGAGTWGTTSLGAGRLRSGCP